MHLFFGGPSTSASSQKVLVLCGLCCEPNHKRQLQRWISLLFSPRMFIPYLILQRWRFLCVPALKIKVLRWVFSSGHNHQRRSWTATYFKLRRSEVNTLKRCQELKCGGNIRAAQIQKWKHPPARSGVAQQLQLAPPWIPVLLQSD